MENVDKETFWGFVIGILVGAFLGLMIGLIATHDERLSCLWVDEQQQVIQYKDKYYRLVELKREWKEETK